MATLDDTGNPRIVGVTPRQLHSFTDPCMLGRISDAYATLQLANRLRQAGAGGGVEARATAGLDDGVAA
jgi:hypothetical protein